MNIINLLIIYVYTVYPERLKEIYLLEFIDSKENILKKNNREDNGKKTEYKEIDD